jgi:cell division protein FtsB
MKINNFLFRVRHGGLIVIGSVLLLFFFGAMTVRESYRGWKVDQEIQALEDQADELEGRNKRLMEIAQSLGSPERMEVEARKRLGMRKPGEQVVVLEGMSASGSWETQMQLDVVPEKAETPRSNPELWLDYFFRPERL